MSPVEKCYQQLSRQADAIYVTALTCVDRNVEKYVGIFNDHKIPTFFHDRLATGQEGPAPGYFERFGLHEPRHI